MKRNKALLIAYNMAPFVLCDYLILSEEFKTDIFLTGKSNKSLIYTSFRLLLLFIRILLKKFDLIYIWGLDFNSLIPSIFKNFKKFKLVIIPLGYEIDSMKEIKYGNSNKFKEFITFYSARKADAVICTSEYALNRAKNLGINSCFVHLCLNR